MKQLWHKALSDECHIKCYNSQGEVIISAWGSEGLSPTRNDNKIGHHGVEGIREQKKMKVEAIAWREKTVAEVYLSLGDMYVIRLEV